MGECACMCVCARARDSKNRVRVKVTVNNILYLNTQTQTNKHKYTQRDWLHTSFPLRTPFEPEYIPPTLSHIFHPPQILWAIKKKTNKNDQTTKKKLS